MMIGLCKQNPLLRNPRYLIALDQLPFLTQNSINNWAAANPQTHLFPFTGFYFSTAASNFHLESPKTKDPNPVFDFFQSYGFTEPEIRRLICKFPSFPPTEKIKPTIEHLLAFGFSPSDLIKTICHDPILLRTSLEKRVAPNLSFLESTFSSKTRIIEAVCRGPWLLRNNVDTLLIPNLKILRESDIPMDKITLLFVRNPLALSKHSNVIIEAISKLKALGMKPSTSSFIYGIIGMTLLKRETWERKMKLYKSLGCSEIDTMLAFSKQPKILLLSDDKIKKQFEFFKEKLHWDSQTVLKYPVLIMYSLEGRTIPRCSVLSVLAENGLWHGKPSLYGLFNMSEKDLEKKFVEKYAKDVPRVLDAYQGKVEFKGFESKF